MTKVIKAKSYSQERKVWYKKLKETGFNDLENSQGFLKAYASSNFSQTSPHAHESRREYYYLCQQFLNEFKFDSELQKAIWEYHTNGISYRDIAKTVRKVFEDQYKNNLEYILKKHSAEEKKLGEASFDLAKKVKQIKLRRPTPNTIMEVIKSLEDKMKAEYIGKV